MAQPPPPLPPMQSQIPSPLAPTVPAASHPILDELREKNNYNPPDYDLSAKGARFFVIKSYSEDDIHRWALFTQKHQYYIYLNIVFFSQVYKI
jgi:hypothetical protein